MTDLDAIRARHVRYMNHDPMMGTDEDACEFDNYGWPCDTAIVLAALDEIAASQEREARLRAALTPERMAAALVESDLIRRYDEYARVAYPVTMTRDHLLTLAASWAPLILAALATTPEAASA